MDEHGDLPPLESLESVNDIIDGYNTPALPSIYKKSEKVDIIAEATALVASANEKTQPERRVGNFEMMEVLQRSLNRTILNITNPPQRAFTALRELSDFVNMATTGAKPKIAGVHTDLLPVGHPLSTQQHSFSSENVVEVRAVWMSADPRIADDFRPLVASAFKAPANSLEREYVMAKLEATSVTEVPREIILSLTASGDPYGGGNSFLARSARARAQRRDRKGRFAWMGGGARVWLGTFDGVSTLFRFCGYDANSDSFDLEIFNHPTLGTGIYSIPASKVEAVKAILPDNYLDLPDARPTQVDKDLLVDPASLVKKDAPTGWTKVSSANGVDTFRSTDGWVVNRYQNASDAPTSESITRVRGANVDKSIAPNMPVYHISRGSADGTVTDSPIAMAQSWADTQALIAKHDKLNPEGSSFKAKVARKIPDGWTQVEDENKSDYILRDPTGRYEAVSMSPEDNAKRTRPYAEELKRIQDDPSKIQTFDGAKDFDGNMESLFRLERVNGDGTREIVGYYQDFEDIERDTEINQDDDQSDLFYQQVIENTLAWGGNTVDFVDGNAPIDGYIVAHAPDIPNADGTLRKREEIYDASILSDPEETAKLLRRFALKNADKLTQKGFYLGTWTESQDVKDANGNVIDNREMLFLDVSEYVKDFNDAFDKAEERKEVAWYGVTEGESFYPDKERQRREVFADGDRLKQSVTPEEKKRLYDALNQANQRMNEVNREGNVGPLNWTRDYMDWPNGLEPDEKERLSPEMYQAAMDWLEADKAYKNLEGDYYRAIFEMVDGFDPGGRREGLYGRALQIRDKYVGDDAATLRMNETLRGGADVPSRAKEMDSLVNKSALKRDFVFFRGIWLDQGVVEEMNAGDSFHDRAFQSMAFDEGDAQMYLSGREERGDISEQESRSRVVLRLVVPEGTNAINVGQGEVVLRRNTKMTIIRKSTGRYNGGDGRGTKPGEELTTTYLDVLVEPQTKEEIDARTQGLVKKSKTDSDTAELLPDDGRGADGVGTPSPSQTLYRGKEDSGNGFGTPGFVESTLKRVKERKRKKQEARALGTERLSNLKKLWSDAFDDTVATQPKLHTSLFENTSEEERKYIRKLFFSLGIASDSYSRPIHNPKRESDLFSYLSSRAKYVARAEQINRALRSGSSEMKTAVMNLDRAINNFSRLKRDVVLYKSEDLDPAILSKIEVGDILYERAYSVTTLSEESAKESLKSASPAGKVIYRMATPEGTPAVYTSMGVALPRNLKMSVVGKTVKDGITYVDVYVDRQSTEEQDQVLQGLVKNPDNGGLVSPQSLYVNKNPQMPVYYGAKKGKNIDDRVATARAARARQEEIEAAKAGSELTQEQIDEASRVAKEIADKLPKDLSDLFDPSNPVNILNAEIVTDDIVGEQPSGPAPAQVDKDELLAQKVLFMRPNANWAEIDKALQESSSPVAKEILRLLKSKYEKIYSAAKLASEKKAKADVARAQALKDISNVYENLKTTFSLNPQFRLTLDPIVDNLIRQLKIASGPQGQKFLRDNDIGLVEIDSITDLVKLSLDPSDANYYKEKLDIAILAKRIFSRNINDPQKMKTELFDLAMDVVMGSHDHTDVNQAGRAFTYLTETHGENDSVAPLLDLLPPNLQAQTERLLQELTRRIVKSDEDNMSTLTEASEASQKLAYALSEASMEVLSDAGLEFKHGVKLSDQDINWHPPSDYEVSEDRTQTRHIPLSPDEVMGLARELRTKQGQLGVMNEALSRMPKPVALLLKKWFIDNKSIFSTNGGTRGAVSPSSPSFADPNYKHGDPIQNLRVNLTIDGSNKQDAVACAVHEMWHILANYALPGQLNGVEWARHSALTQRVDGLGKVFDIQVDSNRGVSLVGNSNDMAPKDNLFKLWLNEVSGWAPEFVAPYIGKYGMSSGGLNRGSNPLASAEMMTSIVETLLGGGRGGGLMSPNDMAISGRRIRAGFNPDGTPRYITYNPDLIAESMLPVGVTFVMLANELAKIRLGASIV